METPSAWIASINLHVADVQRSATFYALVLGFRQKFVDDSSFYAELDAGGSTLALTERGFAAEQSGADSQGPPCLSELAVAVPDVEAAMQRAIRAGAKLVSRPETKYWGQTIAYVRDLDGHLIQLCTPV